MKISVIGAGYVGLTTAACLAQIGHKLQNGVIPIFEPHLEKIVHTAAASGKLRFGSTEGAIGWADVIFICVGTPPLPNGDADLARSCALLFQWPVRRQWRKWPDSKPFSMRLFGRCFPRPAAWASFPPPSMPIRNGRDHRIRSTLEGAFGTQV